MLEDAVDNLVAFPTTLPWFLAAYYPPEATRRFLRATVAVLCAFAQDRENRGFPLDDDGLEGLLETALEAWDCDASERARLDAAYAVTLVELA